MKTNERININGVISNVNGVISNGDNGVISGVIS